MNIYKTWYRFLCDVRNVLNRWIAAARRRAYPRLRDHIPESNTATE